MKSTSRTAGLALSAVLTGAAAFAPAPSWAQALFQMQGSQPAVQAASLHYRDGVYTGPSVSAYYGDVRIQVQVRGGRVVGVRVLDYPSDRSTSRYINSRALPWLEHEVIRAQSASVHTVSGATLSSHAFIRSTAAALRQAGG